MNEEPIEENIVNEEPIEEEINEAADEVSPELEQRATKRNIADSFDPAASINDRLEESEFWR